MGKTPLVGHRQQERFTGDRKQYTDYEGKLGEKGNQSCARSRLRPARRGTGERDRAGEAFDQEL